MLFAPAVLRVSAFAESNAHQFGSTVGRCKRLAARSPSGGRPQQGRCRFIATDLAGVPELTRCGAQPLWGSVWRPSDGRRAGGSNPSSQAAGAPARAGPVAPAQARPAVDPVATLIATSQKHFETGERELKARPPRARPQRVRSRGRRAARVAVRRTYRRPDARTLRPTDRPDQRPRGHGAGAGRRLRGNEDTKPASIDELLKIATFPKPDADGATEGGGQGRPGCRPITTSPSRRTRRCSRTSKCSRGGFAITFRKACPRRRSTCR